MAKNRSAGMTLPPGQTVHHPLPARLLPFNSKSIPMVLPPPAPEATPSRYSSSPMLAPRVFIFSKACFSTCRTRSLKFPIAPRCPPESDRRRRQAVMHSENLLLPLGELGHQARNRLQKLGLHQDILGSPGCPVRQELAHRPISVPRRCIQGRKSPAPGSRASPPSPAAVPPSRPAAPDPAPVRLPVSRPPGRPEWLASAPPCGPEPG